MNLMGDEKQYYWTRWTETRDNEAADYLIKLYEPLVQFHVRRLRVGLPNTVTTDELMSYGYMGLYDALVKFDVSRDLKFDTYASFRIRGAILDGLRRDDPIPRTLREKSKKVDAITERLEQLYKRNVTIDEIAEEMGISSEEVESIITDSFLGSMKSIDDEFTVNERRDKIAHLIEDKGAIRPEQNMIKDEMIQALAQHITSLNEKEQIVISLFYHEELTLTEIGKVMSLSTSRVSQIHSKALLKLRKVLETNTLFNERG
ncbi:FliA/WhiG family RNA polymerase sigma factor [Pullulanibacillus pueri]|uniref:FliA/WhiG family RNA polymerase sigma factor n=1 Tax=Pullulanibacillus pueri TaxID=1437324 RepID=UPI0035710522